MIILSGIFENHVKHIFTKWKNEKNLKKVVQP